jgi:hypothetical protein
MPNLSITERLLSLSHLNKPALAKLWQRFFESNPPLGMQSQWKRPFPVSDVLQKLGAV